MSKPFIYFSGDSFMAGDELADDTLDSWKTHIGSYKEPLGDYKEQEKLVKKYYETFAFDRGIELKGFNEEQIQNYRKIQRERTFADIFCKLNNFDYVNDALGGSSQISALHRAIHSFNEFEKQGLKPDLAIIMLTSANRFTWYETTGIKNSNEWSKISNLEKLRNDRSLLYNTINPPAEDKTAFIVNYTQLEPPIGALCRHLNDIILTNTFFKHKTGKNPLYVIHSLRMLTNFQVFQKIPMPNYKPDNLMFVHNFYEQMCGDPVVLNTLKNIDPGLLTLFEEAYKDITILSLGSVHDPSWGQCPLGHYPPKTHEAFAHSMHKITLDKIYNGVY